MRGADDETGDAIRAAAAAVRAPDALREHLAGQHVRLARRRRITGALAATAATVLAAVLALSQTGGGSPRPPTIAETAAIALRTPALPAPKPAAASGELRSSAGGVAFPDYAQGTMDWRPDGQLRARSGGREIAVVSYARAGTDRTGYAIVDGPPLRESEAASHVYRGGTRYAVQRDAGTTIVTWRRGGRTCVLASHYASAAALLRMAARRPPQRAAPYGT